MGVFRSLICFMDIILVKQNKVQKFERSYKIIVKNSYVCVLILWLEGKQKQNGRTNEII